MLARVCVLTARSSEAQEAVQAITDLLADHLASWVFEVWLHRGGESLELMARSVARSIPAERRERLIHPPPHALLAENLPAALVARSGEGRTWNVEDPDLDPTHRENLVALEAGEITAIPIRDNGNVLGVAIITPPPERSVSDEEGEALGIVLGNMALLLDRIHRLEVDKARAEQISRLQTAVESLPVVVKVLSPDWVIEYVNPAVEDVLGYSPEELVGQPISVLRDMHGPGSRQAEVEVAVRQGPWTGDLLDRRKDGRSVLVRIVVAPVRNAEGEVTGIVEVAQDLSHAMEQEKRAKHAYRMAMVGQLAASVAHEVNNPLAAITMLTRVLLEEPLPDALRKDLEIINSEAHRAGGISRNLLVFARQTDIQKTAVDLREAVREVVRLRLPELRLWEIDAEVRAGDDLPAALANAGHIRQVLHNLISNAAQAIQDEKDRGWIGIALSSDDEGWLQLTVEDDGPGIPEGALTQVMTPFFTTKAMGKGTGLGLSVSRDIVEDHGGQIHIENRAAEHREDGRPERGVRVTIRLPAVLSETPAHTQKTTAGAQLLESARLLVVDDDLAVALALQRLLKRMGYVTDVVHRGEAALDRISQGEQFDVILTDLNMPGIGGEGVYREIERARPDLLGRLVFMSGELAPEASHEFLRQTPGRILEKPFTPNQLRAVLGTVLKAHGQ